MDALPPDPYLALGVAKDATAAAIKTQYRKLVLKCHPDKVDDSQKAEASDKFHKIQTAWEIVGNEARRQRYDKQCLLEQLRKESMMSREGTGRGGVDVRTAGYRMPTEQGRGEFFATGPQRYAPRASPPYEPQFEPQYEERRPAYAQQEDYFDQQPRPASRKQDEYERPFRRSSPKDERPKAKVSTRDAKESERSSRKDKSRRTEKDIRRDRDRKTTRVTVEDVDSDSERDAYARARKMRAEEQEKLEQQKLARDRYEEVTTREREAASNGAYTNERASKTLREADATLKKARESTRTRPETFERRPSPPDRMASSKDRFEQVRQTEERRPDSSRRGSGNIKSARHESRSGSDRERDEHTGARTERSKRSGVRHVRVPAFEKSTSAPPAETRPSYERQRSQSVQEDFYGQATAQPAMRRADTSPLAVPSAAPRDSRGRKEGSKLRPQEAYVTSEPTPEAQVRPTKDQYGHRYADDNAYGNFETEYREPSDKRIHNSPEPLQERSRERERQRSASSKKTAAPQPPHLPRTTSTSYRYTPTPIREQSTSSRPSMSRENSLPYEIRPDSRPTASPRNSSSYPAPSPGKIHTGRLYSDEDVNYANYSGYGSRRSDRPTAERTYSRQPVY